MNPKQIEEFLDVVDGNLHSSVLEAKRYIVENRDAIVRSLARDGWADIKTSAGSIRITLKDLELLAA